jgi:hypothetical protein
MIHVYWGIVTFLALCVGFMLGHEKGIDNTLKYFTTHPIPRDWIKICRLDHSELVRESHSKGIQYVTCPDCDEELS